LANLIISNSCLLGRRPGLAAQTIAAASSIPLITAAAMPEMKRLAI
jgi:hypothetical protein